MSQYNYKLLGADEFRSAIRKNPGYTKTEVGKFLVRAMAEYNRGVIRNPWRIGMTGGGAPKASGHLRDTHRREIKNWEAWIFPTAPYASYVHGLGGQTHSSRGLQLRPWLDYVFKDKESAVEKLEKDLLKNIVKQLSK